MSSGGFSRSKYELDGSAQIVPVRVQPETILLDIDGTTNAEPAGNVTLSVTAYTRKSARQYGIGCRSITIAWNAGPPANYEDENLSIPILTVAAFAAINVGDTGTYLGTACTVVSKKSEQLT